MGLGLASSAPLSESDLSIMLLFPKAMMASAQSVSVLIDEATAADAMDRGDHREFSTTAAPGWIPMTCALFCFMSPSWRRDLQPPTNFIARNAHRDPARVRTA